MLTAAQAWQQITSNPRPIFIKSNKRTAEFHKSMQLQTHNDRDYKSKLAWQELVNNPEPQFIKTNKQSNPTTQIKKYNNSWDNFYNDQYPKNIQPPNFMAAFQHVQPYVHSSQINIDTRNSLYHKAYSCFESLPSCLQNPYKNQKKQFKLKKQQYKDYFEIQSVVSQGQIQPQNIQIQQQRIFYQNQMKNTQLNIQWSKIWNYQQINSNIPQKIKIKNTILPTTNEYHKNWIMHQFQKSNTNLALQKLQKQLNLHIDSHNFVTQKTIISQITKMLQSVECDLFTLDYQQFIWKIQPVHFRVQNIFQRSLSQILQKMMTIASVKIQLSAVINFLNKKKHRKIYYQLSHNINENLVIFQQLLLEAQKNTTLLMFVNDIQSMGQQLIFLHNLIINKDQSIWQNKNYQQLDFKCLQPELIIFKKMFQIVNCNNLMGYNDSNMQQQLFKVVFNPIIYLIQSFIFQEGTNMEMNDEIYLKYYISDPKQLFNLTSRNIAVIKQQSNQLYLICKYKIKIKLLEQIEDIKQYKKQWEVLFNQKSFMIQRVRNAHITKIQRQKARKTQQKIQELQDLRNKLYQIQLEEAQRKKDEKDKKKKQFQRMKKLISENEQKRKLLLEIQKQKQKALQLQRQMKQKEKLDEEKKKLLQQINKQTSQQNRIIIEEKNVNNNIIIEPEQLDQHQQNPRISEQALQLDKKQKIPQNQIMQQQKQKIVQQPLIQDIDPNSQSQPIQAQPLLDQTIKMVDQSQPKYNNINIQSRLQLCITEIINQQIQTINSCLKFIILQKHKIEDIFRFLRTVFLSAQGDKLSEFISLSINQQSMLSLKHFNQCLLIDTNKQNIQSVSPFFYLNHQDIRKTQINIFDQNLQYYIGFQFKKLPKILAPFFTYIHFSKYMQIFGFIIRLKHAQHLISQSWKILNIYSKKCQQKIKNGQNAQEQLVFIKTLCFVRYKISNFMVILMNHLFFNVIQREINKLSKKINDLQDLGKNHLKMLENILRSGFIDNPQLKFQKRIKKLIKDIQQFYRIVIRLSLDDIPHYAWKQTKQKAEKIGLQFSKQCRIFENQLFKTI